MEEESWEGAGWWGGSDGCGFRYTELRGSGGLLEVGVSGHRSQESVVKAQVQSKSRDQLRATDGGVEPECMGGLEGGQPGGRASPGASDWGGPPTLPLLTSHLLFV